MDRLSQLRDKAGGASDSTLDTSSPPSEAYLTANLSTSKYYSLSEVDSTFDISTIKDDISSIKDVSLPSASTESEGTMTNADELISNLSPIRKKSDILDSYKIDTQIEAANILSGGVAIFDDNDNSYDGDELVIDDNVDDEKSAAKQPENLHQFNEPNLMNEEMDIGSKDTEVVLQIDGKNVDAIDIGNGLYLYRKAGQEELAAVQIIEDDQQQPSFKFLKVRENAEGNLEVYEEIEIEVLKEVPAKEGKSADKNTSHVPIKDLNRVITDSTCNKTTDVTTPKKDQTSTIMEAEVENKESSLSTKSEVNLNGKMMKFSESRKSPVIGTFTPMTYHSTPNKEGIPLTKIMVDQQLHTNRHSDMTNIKKTIEVHTDNNKLKSIETNKNKEIDENKVNDTKNVEKEAVAIESSNKNIVIHEADPKFVEIKEKSVVVSDTIIESNKSIDDLDKTVMQDAINKNEKNPLPLDISTGSTKNNIATEKTEVILHIDDNNLITVHEAQFEDNVQVVNIEESKKIVQVNTNERKNEIKMHIQENEREQPSVQVENTVAQKNEQAVLIDNIGEKIDGKVVKLVMVKDTEETITKPAEHIENSYEKKGENVDQAESIEDIKLEASADALKILLSNISDANIEEKKYECEVVPMEIDTCIESPIQISITCAEKNKITANSNIQTEQNIANTINNETQKSNEVIMIDQNNDASIDRGRVVGNEEKCIQNEQNLNISEPDLKNISKVQEVKVETEDVTTKNNESKLKEAIQVGLDVSNIKNKIDSKEITDSSIVLSEQVAKKVGDLLSAKESKISHISKPMLDQEQLIKKTEIDSEVSVLQQANVNKSSIIVTKTCISKILDTKQNKKITESIALKESTLKEDPIKYTAHINKLEISEQNQRNYEVITVNPIMSPNTGKSIFNNLNTNKETEIRQIDTNVLQKTTQKYTMRDTPVIEFQPIQVINNVQVSVTPVAKVNKSQNELNTVKETNIQENKPEKNQSFDIKPSAIIQTNNMKDLILPLSMNKEKCVVTKSNDINKVPKSQPNKSNLTVKEEISSTSKIVNQNIKNINELKDKVAESKPINNNAAVPFGKWTEANRQEFLNKFKTKTLVASSNSNQLKNSNDLNRRDVLKKIDSQRQSSNALSKAQEPTKLILKPETAAFSNKPNPNVKETSLTDKVSKNEALGIKLKAVSPKNVTMTETVPKIHSKPSHAVSITKMLRHELCQRTGVVQHLIDKTIEGMIHRSKPAMKVQDDKKPPSLKEISAPLPLKLQQSYQPIEQGTLDEIEMKMNELHGIPFIERPPHELPQVNNPETKSYSKTEQEKLPVTSKTKIPNLLPYPNKNQSKVVQESVIEVDSEDEIIEHEPITGDIDMNKKNQVTKHSVKEMLPSIVNLQMDKDKVTTDSAKREAIITEKDFDKFARRNSITYENCITVNFDGTEPHNVIQTVVEKDLSFKNLSMKEHADQKIKSPKYQSVHTNIQTTKIQPVSKFMPAHDEASNRNQSKLQKAYHSVLTAKRQMAAECPITIIEDKPVKVVFMESVDYIPSQLNVQGQDLSPTKKNIPDTDVTVSACGSLDSYTMDPIDELKSQDDIKTKTKHQRKQVLTPVEAPELELIEPSDLGIEISPKKKRRTDEDSRDKNLKYPTRKKLYLLSSSAITEEKLGNGNEIEKKTLKQIINNSDNGVEIKNPVSALDSLVKAAELIETQTDNITKNIASNPDQSKSSTPVKRGRGRPRKYPLTPDGIVDKSKVTAVSPQKKPRLIDTPVKKLDISTDDSDSDSEIIKENWTMGKINENIVCPICNKLFRTENVVFKHVKHCTGPSPSRSDSDKRSPRGIRISQDFDTKSQNSKSDDMDDDKPLITRIGSLKKHASKDSLSNTKPEDNDDIIVIEDTPIKENSEKEKKVEMRQHESRKPKSKIPQKDNLVCEFCGKTFRQLSYLISHKIQHKKNEKGSKKATKEASLAVKSIYSCEVCKKEFRKLHHLVQHRIIHNPSTASAKSSRKTFSEQPDSKIDKDLTTQKQGEDQSAGFRCEPCDKSFRKLHHLVEHRETHDGINRQKTSTLPTSKEEKLVERSVLHECDICKKAFKKVQDLNEHKEEHTETSSEKTVTVNDIIHECAICYMVFPNEHSLNKHTIICQRKKRQSKLKKPVDDSEGGDKIKTESEENLLPDKHIEDINSPTSPIEVDIVEANKEQGSVGKVELIEDINDKTTTTMELDVPKENLEKHTNEANVLDQKLEQKTTELDEKEPDKSIETPKKKAPSKEKSLSATKRLKTTNTTKQVTVDVKTAIESSDDDEVRYMLNPNYKVENVTVEKIFMKVKAKKRNSLQIERPNSKELVKRRTSLQHPPKIPRLKPKAIEPTVSDRKAIKPILEPSASTDSDDSETTKYSFPVTIPVKSTKSVQNRTPKKSERKTPKKSLVDKRKSLSAIAKRKSMGNSATAKPKASPLKQVKKRTLNVEYRCDCGQLFSSAALLSRHTSQAHTPPRIRRKRSPPPKPKQSTAPKKTNPSGTPPANSKTEKSDAPSSVKPRRSTAHRGVPVPEKMRKLMLNHK